MTTRAERPAFFYRTVGGNRWLTALPEGSSLIVRWQMKDRGSFIQLVTAAQQEEFVVGTDLLIWPRIDNAFTIPLDPDHAGARARAQFEFTNQLADHR